MPRRKKPAVKHDRISAKIERWNASVEIAVNRDPLTPWQPTSPDDRVYQPEARLEIEAIITTPGKRSGHPIAITVYGAKENHDVLQLKLKHVHVLDKNRVPLYKTYRGMSLPVYDLENAFLGLIDKWRGEGRWSGYLWLDPELLDRMVVLLQSGRDVYASIHEATVNRGRRIISFSLQTKDPEEE